MTDEHFGISIIEYMVSFAAWQRPFFILNSDRSQAAGVAVLAHDSGGPKSDIVVPFKSKPTGAVKQTPRFAERLSRLTRQSSNFAAGFLADSAASYADQMRAILTLGDSELEAICRNARNHVVKDFSSGTFEATFVKCISAPR